jgi:two-component system, response regulator
MLYFNAKQTFFMRSNGRMDNRIKILVAEDDPDDKLLLKEAFHEAGGENHLVFVDNGQELIDHLLDKQKALPGLILLDLNMPKKNGMEALKEIKADPHLRKIPVIVLTTSKMPEDINSTYGYGVNCFINKPTSYNGMVAIARIICDFWGNVVVLPKA